MGWLDRLFSALVAALRGSLGYDEITYIPLPPVENVAPAVPPPEPVPVPSTVPGTVPAPAAFDWSTKKGAFHAVRVIGDEVGLTVAQKDVLCACIYQESAFDNAAVCKNKDKTGAVWSRDWGICQVNDYFHIGPGKDFPSVEFVIAHPEACVRWMAVILKRTGGLQPWSSFSSGAYRRWLSTTSPMWKLRA